MSLAPRNIVSAAAFAATILAASGVAAHHGWGSYDSTSTLKLTGTIEASEYQNPHGELRLRAEQKLWHVVLAPPSRMQNRGLPPEMLKTGATVTVEGYPHKMNAEEIRAERITVDGKTIELR